MLYFGTKPDPIRISVTKRSVLLTLLCLQLFAGHELAAQAPEINRVLTVRDGLPQSYVSGICQDSKGFLWIATLNGLGRYDGRNFKYYWHTSADSAGLRGNIILRMLNIGKDLLLCYSDGKIDLLNTETEKVRQLGGTPAFNAFKTEIGFLRGLISDGQGLCWMVARDGGIYKLDWMHNVLTHLSPSSFGLHEPILGVGAQNGRLMLLTESRLYLHDQRGTRIIPYPFGRLSLFARNSTSTFSLAIRADGELLIGDAQGILTWNLSTNTYKKWILPKKQGPGTQVSDFDPAGNYFFEHEGSVYMLKSDNTLTEWASPSGMAGNLTVMYVDRSGVFWVGTNGYGLRQYNLARSGMPGYANKRSFVVDVLGHYGLDPQQTNKTFLGHSVPFANRTATGNEGIWIADRYHITSEPELLLFSGGKLVDHMFHPDHAPARNDGYGVQFIAFDDQQILWGMDQHFRLLKFNTHDRSFQIAYTFPLEPTEDINGMVYEAPGVWYISSTRHLLRLDLSARQTTDLTPRLPNKDLLTAAADPRDPHVLWIGTLSDGVMRYDKGSGKTQVFSMATGLPNNTVYSMLPGKDRQLWCSSNKGIFLFEPSDGDVRSFTSRDGLLDDEFNRYYAMRLPDSSLAFGGPLGYTVFDASKLTRDEFDPAVNLTALSVSNLGKLETPLADLTQLSLNHDQNFITAEFAAMQFNAPDKIQYRYMLDGFDTQWVIAGNQPKATYTSLPPGRYTLMLNASNTSGKWSRHILSIRIIIAPPFWKIWWVQVLCVAAAALLIFVFVHARIRRLKKTHARILQFERQAMELHAVSLRAQMNPHFIFNCLNSIKALIQENQNKTAARYLTSFVALIRKQLNNTKNEIPLSDELHTCRLYLELEAMRFEEHIQYHFEIEAENLDQISIPPLTLQPLIENAIIHGLLPKENGGTVSVRVYREGAATVCAIEDDGIGRAASARQKEKISRLHESKGVQLLEKRIGLFNQFNKHTTLIETLDLVDANGEASGTLVMIKLNTI